MKIVQAVLLLVSLVLILSIPRLIYWLMSGVIRILIVFNNTLHYFIKSVEEELTTQQNGRRKNTKN